MNKLGYLSCEYLHGDYSYWLYSGNLQDKFGFYKFDISKFKDLIPNEISKNEDFSSITIFDSQVEFRVKDERDEEFELIELDLKNYEFITWNSLFQILLDSQIELSKVTGLIHRTVVEKPTIEEEKINWQDCTYEVTAFLPEQGIIALIGDNYKIGENPNWITLNYETKPDEYKNFLKNIKVLAIKFNGQYYGV